MTQLDAGLARDAYNKAERLASEQFSHVETLAAKRGLAGALFLAQDYEAGRETYRDALKLSKTLQNRDQILYEHQAAYTRAAWGLIEMQTNHCTEARAQVEAFNAARATSSAPIAYAPISPLVEQVVKGLNDCR